jgi:hypothetical protein
MREPSNPGEVLNSCVVPGKEYRNTPYRHGPYELVDARGQVRMLGAWRDNKQDGLWRWWNDRGILRREMTYRDGTPLSDASWDDDGKPINRRVGDHSIAWHPNGHKQMESRPLPDGAREVTTWFENGKPAKRDVTRPAAQEQTVTEWFDNGNQRQHAVYRKNGLADWKGWSSTGQPLDGDRCVEDADCVAVPQNVCYRCVPPYEAITRWREAQRRMHPPPAPTGCDPGPFPCARLGEPPPAVCRASRCTLGP